MKTNKNNHFPFSIGILRSSQASQMLRIAAKSIRKKYAAYISIILLMLTPSLCFAQASVHTIAGINAQTGTSYTIQAVDQTKLVTFNNSNPVTVTLPSAITPNFGVGAIFAIRNLGAGAVTVTPASGTIDGAASLTLSQGQGADIYSDGSNYVSQKGAGGSGSLSGMTSGQIPVAASGSTVTSSKPIQGIDTSILSSGFVSGTAAPLCTDASAGATTTGCPNISGTTSGQVAIAGSPNTIASSKVIQGTDANILSSGTISGTSVPICTDASGGATTVGCPSGGGGSPGGSPVQAQFNNAGAFGGSPCFNLSAFPNGPANFDCDTHPVGPNPVVDITRFGARPCDIRFAPCNTGDTATISLGTPTTATVNNGGDFKIGDGFVIYGAGPATMTTAPTGLGASQSISYAGMETGFTTLSATGASTRCYKVAARNINGAQSPASTETCITNALTAEGPTVNTISSATRSGQTVTLVTTAAHPFLVGCNGVTNCGMVFVSSGLSDGSMRGWYAVLTAPNSTTITYQTQDSTVFGGVTTASGGQITSYPCVHLTWTAPASGTPWGYEIYEGASGAETLIDVSQPQGTNTNLVYDDYGSTMLTGVTNQLPLYLSNTPPGAAIPENLFGTISNISVNTLTLSVAASTAVAGATIRLDAGRSILAAAQTVSSGGLTHAGSVYIPALNNGTFFQYMVNAPVDLRSINAVLDQAGPLYLNEPIAMGTTNNPAVSWYGNRHPQFGGSFGTASPGNHSVVTVERAQPGLYINSGNGVHIEGLTFQGNTACTNGMRGVVMESGFRSFWIDDTFAGCSGSNDNVSIPLMFRGTNTLTVTDFVLDRVGFSPGQGGGGADGGTATPVWYCHFCGNSTLGAIYVVNRGFEYDLGNNGQANVNVIGPLHINGGQMPLFQTTSVIGNGPTGFQISLSSGQTQNVLMDTIAHPCVAGLGLFPPTVTGPCFPSGAPDVSGQPTYRQRGNFNTQSPNTDYWSGGQQDGGGQDSVRMYNYHVATGSSFFTNQIAPPAPTCVVNAGGSLAIGTYTFKIEPSWQDSLQGNSSAASTVCTTSSGNQSITINWTVPTGNPLGMNLYYSFNSTGYASSNTFSFPFPVTTTSFIFSTPPGFNAHFLAFEPRSGPTIVTANQIFTPAITLGGNLLFSGGNGTILSTGSIPSQQFTFYDNFNRANNPVGTGAPVTWVTANGTNTVTSNKFVPTGSGVQNQSVITSPAVPNDQFSEFTLLGGPIQAQVRATQTSPLSAYECSANQGAAPAITMLNSNTFSTLATGTGTLNIGDVVRCEVQGSSAPYTIRFFQNGVLNVSVTDSTIASGFPGIRAFSSGSAVDNFSAGGLNPLAKLTTEQDFTQPQHFMSATVGPPEPTAGGINGTLPYGSFYTNTANIANYVDFFQQPSTPPANPPAGFCRAFFGFGGQMIFNNSAGTACFTGGGGSMVFPNTVGLTRWTGGTAWAASVNDTTALTGQPLVATNGLSSGFASPGIQDGNGAAHVTTTPYAVLCDNTTTIRDRGTTIIFDSGASVVNLPDHTVSGCGNNDAFVLINNSGGNLTVNRGGTDTLDIYGLVGASTIAATSFTFAYNNWAAVNNGEAGRWNVRLAGNAPLPNVTTSTGTTAIAANTCTAGTTVTMTGLVTTQTIVFTPNVDVSGIAGWGSTGGLVIDTWPTANTVNYRVCNPTGSSITPGSSITWNISAR